MQQRRSAWLFAGQALLLWVVVGTVLAWAARIFHPLGPAPWQLGACGLAFAGLVIHLLLLYRKSRGGEDVERVVPHSVMLTAGVTLSFVAIGAPVAGITVMLISPQFGPYFVGWSWDEAATGALLLAYDYAVFPAAFAGLANAVALLLLGKQLSPSEGGFPLLQQAMLGAGAGLFTSLLFGVWRWTDWYIADGLLEWSLPSVLAGAVAGMVVNGAACRHFNSRSAA